MDCRVNYIMISWIMTQITSWLDPEMDIRGTNDGILNPHRVSRLRAPYLPNSTCAHIHAFLFTLTSFLFPPTWHQFPGDPPFFPIFSVLPQSRSALFFLPASQKHPPPLARCSILFFPASPSSLTHTVLRQVVCLHTAPLSFLSAPFAMPHSFSSSADCGSVSTKKGGEIHFKWFADPPPEPGTCYVSSVPSSVGVNLPRNQATTMSQSVSGVWAEKNIHWACAQNIPKSQKIPDLIDDMHKREP